MYATNHVLIYKGSAYSSPCFQVDSGFLEGIVRGYKAGILTQSQYASLGQCETLEGEQSVEDSVGLIHFSGYKTQTFEHSCQQLTMEASSRMSRPHFQLLQ